MINRLFYRLQRPERGWDPVPEAYAREYALAEWQKVDETLLSHLDFLVGGLAGKRVLDLGGGPGQYSVAFAKRGAYVTWHDISRSYEQIARSHAQQTGVSLTFSLGYLEEATRLAAKPFDLVFNRLCWYYCMNDIKFARQVYQLVRPGGAAYIDSNSSAFERARGVRRIIYSLNDRFGLKIGHPHPPHGRIESLFRRLGVDQMDVDYAEITNDRVFFVKAAESQK